MNAIEAVKTAQTLQKSFRDVTVFADQPEAMVVAREHFAGPPKRFRCFHEKTRVARNVSAAIVTDGGDELEFGQAHKDQVYRLNSLTTCCRCDTIIDVEYRMTEL